MHGIVSADVGRPEHVGQKIVRSWVPDDEIPKAHRAFVNGHARRLAKRHGLGTVRVRYFGPARRNARPMEFEGRLTNYGDFYLEARGVDNVTLAVTPDGTLDTIGLYHGVRGEEVVAFLVAHEIRHLIAKRQGTEASEKECDRFASRYVRSRR